LVLGITDEAVGKPRRITDDVIELLFQHRGAKAVSDDE
jgi:hypothetical protein